MAIQVAGIEVQQIEVSLKNKPQGLLDASAKASVPVLITSDGKVLEQSRDIMWWALEQADPENWLFNRQPLIQAQMTQLIDECDNNFKPMLDRYKYFDRYPDQPQSAYRAQAEEFLKKLDFLLSKNIFLFDAQMRFADVAIFPFIRQFAAVDHGWFAQSPYTKVNEWLDKCVNTALFKVVMSPV
jgi:glutathione S-transferase